MKKNLILLFALLLLAGAAWYLIKEKGTSTLKENPFTQFAIEDTASITKIFITDLNGNSVLLERQGPTALWKVNGKYEARKDATDLILDTIKRIRVRGGMNKAMSENMLKVMATAGKKVEIYQGGDTPSKIYYVGTATSDHQGTIMLLEIPSEGKSPDPYITHMEGFTGFLNPRFFIDEMEWRYTGYYHYPALDFKEVKILDNYQPENSFGISYLGGNNISLQSNYNPGLDVFSSTENSFDSLRVKDLLLMFRKLHFESYNTLLRYEAIDSMNKVVPAYTISVTGADGRIKNLDLYLKRAARRQFDDNGVESPWDLDYYWAKTESGEYALAQRFVFGPLLRPLPYYIKRPV